MFARCPSVRSFVRLLPNWWTWYFENDWTDSAKVVQETSEKFNFGGKEIKGQGHTRPKIDLETPLGRVIFLVFNKNEFVAEESVTDENGSRFEPLISVLSCLLCMGMESMIYVWNTACSTAVACSQWNWNCWAQRDRKLYMYVVSYERAVSIVIVV